MAAAAAPEEEEYVFLHDPETQEIIDLIMKESLITLEQPFSKENEFKINKSDNIDETSRANYNIAVDNLFKEDTPERNQHGRNYGEDDKKVAFVICQLYNIQLTADNTFKSQQEKNFVLSKITNYNLLKKENQKVLDEQIYQKYEKYIRSCRQDSTIKIKRKTLINYGTVESMKTNRIRIKKIKKILTDNSINISSNNNELDFIICLILLYEFNLDDNEDVKKFIHQIKVCNYDFFIDNIHAPHPNSCNIMNKYLKYKYKYFQLKKLLNNQE